MFQMHLKIFHIKRNIHDYDIRNTDDIQVPCGRLGIRRFSIRNAGANLWNSLVVYVKSLVLSTSSTDT